MESGVTGPASISNSSTYNSRTTGIQGEEAEEENERGVDLILEPGPGWNARYAIVGTTCRHVIVRQQRPINKIMNE